MKKSILAGIAVGIGTAILWSVVFVQVLGSMAGIGVGLYASKEEAASMVKPDLTFLPQMDSCNRDLALYGWHRAVERAQNWVEVR